MLLGFTNISPLTAPIPPPERGWVGRGGWGGPAQGDLTRLSPLFPGGRCGNNITGEGDIISPRRARWGAMRKNNPITTESPKIEIR